MSSLVWKCFDKVKDKEGVFAICKIKNKDSICKKKFKIIKSSTKELIQHIRKHHETEYVKLFNDKDKEPKEKQIKLDGFCENDFQKCADNSVINFIARTNSPFTITDDIFIHEAITRIYGSSYVRKRSYYSTIALSNAYIDSINKIKKSILNKKLALTTDLWSKPSLDLNLMVLTANYMETDNNRKTKIINVKTVNGKHTRSNIAKLIDTELTNLNVKKSDIIFITRDDGSNIKLACSELDFDSTQCAAHCLNLIVKEAINNVEIIKDLIHRIKCFAGELSRSKAKREVFEECQKLVNLDCNKIPRILDIRWNSIYFCLKAIISNEAAIVEYLKHGNTFIELHSISLIKDLMKILEQFEVETRALCQRDESISRIIPSFKTLIRWMKYIQPTFDKVESIKLCKELIVSLEKRMKKYYCPKIFGALAVDPRYSGNTNFLNQSEWENAYSNIIEFLLKNKDDNEDTSKHLNNNLDLNHFRIESPWDLQIRQMEDDVDNIDIEAKDLILSELKKLRNQSNINIKPFDFYRVNQYPYIKNAVEHFLLPAPTSVESERFFSLATSLYENKHRNLLKTETAEKLLLIKSASKTQELATINYDSKIFDIAENE